MLLTANSRNFQNDLAAKKFTTSLVYKNGDSLLYPSVDNMSDYSRLLFESYRIKKSKPRNRQSSISCHEKLFQRLVQDIDSINLGVELSELSELSEVDLSDVEMNDVDSDVESNNEPSVSEFNEVTTERELVSNFVIEEHQHSYRLTINNTNVCYNYIDNQLILEIDEEDNVIVFDKTINHRHIQINTSNDITIITLPKA